MINNIKLTQEEAIKRLQNTHGCDIDFSKYIYTTSKNKSICICHKHNPPIEWLGRFSHLVNGVGCPKCSKNNIPTTKEVRERFEKKFPTIKFDKFKYVGQKTIISCECTICKNKWSSVYVRLSTINSCPNCKKIKAIQERSPMEKIIKKRTNIDFSKFVYTGTHKKSTAICKKCKKEWMVSTDKLSQGTGCPYCVKNCKLNPEEALKRLNKKCSKYIDLSKFKFTTTGSRSIAICKKCGREWKITYSGLVAGKRCINCYGNVKKTQKEAIAILEKNFEDIDFSKFIYKSALKKSTVICKICKNEWNITYNSLMTNKTGCAKCKSSYYEKKVDKMLTDRNIKYEFQKTFDTCKNIMVLRFDFYLIDFDILVEYNGAQHFVQFMYTDLELIKHRDSIKDEWCRKNNKKLIKVSETKYKTPDNLSLMEFGKVLDKLVSNN